MINLINNINSTSFYDMNKNFLCEGCSKKNTGIFHLLHTKPHIMHAIENTSNKNRYTTLAFIK